MFKKIITSSIIALIGVVGFLGNIQIYEGIDSISLVNNTFAAVGGDPCLGPNPPVPCQSAQNPTGSNTDYQKMLQSLVNALNIILDILTIIVSPAIMLASWLMSPDWTSGDLFGIRTVLHDLWKTISEITYLIYTVLLVFIALATIFNSDHYGYKQLLPRLAVGIILVPMTWWFVSFVISLSSYVTASIIEIPSEKLTLAMEKAPDKGWWLTPSIPTKMKYENNKLVNDGAPDSDPCKTEGGCLAPRDVMKNSTGIYGGLMVYSYGVFRLQDVKKIPTLKDVPLAIGQIINQGIVGVLMFVIYGILVLGLIFMLLMRAIKLWFYAIFSPFFTLKYVIGDGFSKVDKDGTFNITEFIGLAFTPALVGLALSFGLIVISVVMNPTTPGRQVCEGPKCTIKLLGMESNTIVTEEKESGGKKATETTITFGKISYKFSGSVSAGGGNATGGVKSALEASMGIVGTIVLDIIALVFIWVAFMAAAGASKAAGKAIEPFKQMGENIGKMGAKLPQYAPIPGLGMSVKGMGKVVDNAQTYMERVHDKKFKESAAGQWFGGDQVVSEADINEHKKLINAGYRADTTGKMAKINGNAAGIDGYMSSELPKNIVEGVHKLSTTIEKEEFLRKNGYNDATAKLLRELIDKKKGDWNALKNNRTFEGYMKSAAAKPGGTGKEESGIQIHDKSDKNFYSIEIGNEPLELNVSGKELKLSTQAQKDALKTITKEDFERVLKRKLKDADVKEIVDKLGPDKFKTSTPTTSTTATSTPKPPTGPSTSGNP